MAQHRRPAFALFAGFVLAVAAACGGSSATPAAGSAAPGATKAPAASAANPNDPNSILSAALNTSADIKSFHIKIELNGTILASALKDSGNDALSALTSDVKLDGTSVEGDVDLANGAAHLVVAVPANPVFGGQPIDADLILKDQVLYYKLALLGPKYSKMDLGSLTSSLPVSVPSIAAPSSGTDMTAQLADLEKQLQDAGVKATLVGVDKIGGQDANHINMSIPLDMINQQIAASSPSPMVTIDSASLDFWIYKANSQIAKVELKGASAAIGNLDLVVTVTDYNAPVSIAAPAAGDINPAG